MEFIDDVVDSIKSFWDGLKDSSQGFCESKFEDIDAQDLIGNQIEILLLDVSRSMDSEDYPPSRLDGAKQASISFIKRVAEFNPKSAIAVISFSSRASIVSTPLPVTTGITILKEAVNSLKTKGCTNISAGLTLSERVIQKCENSINPRILMLTDGGSNEGGSPIPVAERLKSQGVQIDIIGIGGSPADVNEDDLQIMASVVNGELRYWFIKSVGQLIKKFENLAIREIR